MRGKIVGLYAASLLALASGGAQAIQTPAGAEADSLKVSESGVGHMLIVPYFTTQGGNAMLLSLINTDDANGKAVKLRFRGVPNADIVYDLHVFLAPGDMWTANVSQNAEGRSYLTTTDGSCTKPEKSKVNDTPFQTERLDPKVTDAQRANFTREGYIEVITMADVPVSQTGISPLIALKDGKSVCADTAANTSWSAMDRDLADVAAYAAHGLTPPTTGLAANWTLMNVPKALSWSGAAMALEARKDGVPAKGNLAYFPQTSDGMPGLGRFSADPLFAGERPIVWPVMYDLPDLSTPYYVGASSAAVQVNAIAAGLEARSVINEYWTSSVIQAKTDWLLSMPTRRFAVGINYAEADASKKAVFNPDVSEHFSKEKTRVTGDALCLVDPLFVARNRESYAPKDLVVVGGLRLAVFCGVTSVLTFKGPHQGGAPLEVSDVLSARTAINQGEGPSADGWAKVGLTRSSNVRIPVIGSAFVSANNPNVAPGTAGNFGVTWPHRLLKN
ncbi:hypothetical protein G7048_14630 [Diaphorobacter sp. HDW4B]|uniref:hypothetical protein n=1 Tax=Diaphorobacter sp. HDW4B TaxID=2714925 RepID=UPI0014090EAA|nr:hypothetical protein [Diaphorobacter sp. HDW4B]QIL71481.1 hypothetical protein G7048_14630 [Diaphorobacter sp. HDW4B]